MRNLNRNKQTLYYALYKGQETKYKLDEDGNKIISYIDESVDPPIEYYEEEGVEEVYENVVKFKGNIAFSGGDSQAVEFGVSQAEYEGVLVVEKNVLPITETSLIWLKSEPTVGVDGHTDPASADYRVIKVSPTLNQDKFILSKVVKNG